MSIFLLALAGIAGAGFVLVLPATRWARRQRRDELLLLVPHDVATAYRRVRAAATLPGIGDTDRVVAEADDLLHDVAAVLAGRPPRGGAQRRFVAARRSALDETADWLEERHVAWTAAAGEVEQLSGLTLPEPEPGDPGGIGSRVLLVVLLPVFLAYDLARFLWSLPCMIFDGVVLRLRLLARLAVAATRRVVAAVAAARRQFLEDLAGARHRFVTARIRIARRARRWRPAR